MQIDLHYYGTYAVAKAAGFPEKDAHIVAYSAQFVDDSTKHDSDLHGDLSLLYGIATAHTTRKSLVNTFRDFFSNLTYKVLKKDFSYFIDKMKNNNWGLLLVKLVLSKQLKHEEERKVWVPFHFYPGGIGSNFEEKIICRKDSKIVNEMFRNNIKIALEKPYGLQLLGISAHVFEDTFSHYGFSGLRSDYNTVNPVDMRKIKTQFNSSEDNQLILKAQQEGKLANLSRLGHGGVSVLADYPYLSYEIEYKTPRSCENSYCSRNNPETFIEALEKLYIHFRDFAEQKGYTERIVEFSDIKPQLEKLITSSDSKEVRIENWIRSELTIGLPSYDGQLWENQKLQFSFSDDTSKNIETEVYRFHQAAAYHRYYTLKDLLPSHGIAVY